MERIFAAMLLSLAMPVALCAAPAEPGVEEVQAPASPSVAAAPDAIDVAVVAIGSVFLFVALRRRKSGVTD